MKRHIYTYATSNRQYDINDYYPIQVIRGNIGPKNDFKIKKLKNLHHKILEKECNFMWHKSQSTWILSAYIILVMG